MYLILCILIGQCLSYQFPPELQLIFYKWGFPLFPTTHQTSLIISCEDHCTFPPNRLILHRQTSSSMPNKYHFSSSSLYLLMSLRFGFIESIDASAIIAAIFKFVANNYLDFGD